MSVGSIVVAVSLLFVMSTLLVIMNCSLVSPVTVGVETLDTGRHVTNIELRIEGHIAQFCRQRQGKQVGRHVNLSVDKRWIDTMVFRCQIQNGNVLHDQL